MLWEECRRLRSLPTRLYGYAEHAQRDVHLRAFLKTALLLAENATERGVRRAEAPGDLWRACAREVGCSRGEAVGAPAQRGAMLLGRPSMIV